MSSPDDDLREHSGRPSWDDAPCGLLQVDARGVIVEANRRALDYLGCDPGELVGRQRLIDVLAVGSRLFYETQLAPVLELDGALNEVMLDLRRPDGERVPVLVNGERINPPNAAAGGTGGHRFALMSVSDRRAYEDELRQARHEAERATAAESRARRRMELLTRANTALASSSELSVALQALARVLVADMADWCLVYAEPDGSADEAWWSAAHADAVLDGAVQELGRLFPLRVLAGSNYQRVRAGGKPTLLAHVTDDDRRRSTDSAEVLELYAQLGLESVLIVPGRARGHQVATIVLARGPNRPPYTEQDLTDLTALGTRAGIAIDNLRQHAREHNNSVALQRALLTSPPQTPTIDIVIRYLPATAGNQVGGDWYDAFLQADGTPVIVIGDVMGHDIHAAAAMGQLRGIIRTLGFTPGVTPAEILTQADSTAGGLGVARLASAVVARIEHQDGTARLQWSNAGHPPPLMITGGVARTLEFRPEPILGLGPARERHNHTTDLATGDVVVLYTDGLVESAEQDIDTGMGRLIAQVSGQPDLPLDRLCDVILDGHGGGRSDDIALLLLRLLG